MDLSDLQPEIFICQFILKHKKKQKQVTQKNRTTDKKLCVYSSNDKALTKLWFQTRAVSI